ncbi:MAG: YraN family protein [Rhodospirillales bacterium]|nr:YraN family protein [Rhodospirillales bacterium]MCB9964501.1 YraN family protein [Rhodospirillales bacterium]MCB9973774.1 YraN family protein [Rhodospirillales bacterium]MCB9980342.1 YraN family protein [Rhodospirillales bacterium]
MKAKTSYQKGLWAESYAAILLRLKGYRILRNRYKTPFGEIDLIAYKKQTLIAVEVKFRAEAGAALAAVGPASRRRIRNAAEFFRAHHPPYATCDVRFDIITITPSFLIRHHKNAWYDAE